MSTTGVYQTRNYAERMPIAEMCRSGGRGRDSNHFWIAKDIEQSVPHLSSRMSGKKN
jgi:hypothetical protein